MQEIHSARYRLDFTFWLDAIFLLGVAIYVIAGKDFVPFHGDEATFIYMSRDYTVLVKGHHPGQLLYNPSTPRRPHLQAIRIQTGAINSFTIGWASDLAGVRAQSVRGTWLWNYLPSQENIMWSDNIRKGRLPSPGVLSVARWPPALFGALSVVLFFLFVRQLTHSRLAAWIATLALASNPDFLLNVRRAMQEGSKFFFLILTLCLAVYVLRQVQKDAPNLLRYILLGLASGAALASKQDIAPMLVAIYGSLGLVPLIEKRGARYFLQNLLNLAATTCVALGVFLALMPVWWGSWKSVVIFVSLAALLFHIMTFRTSALSRVVTLASLVVLIGITIFSTSAWLRLPQPFKVMAEAREESVRSHIAHRSRFHLPYLDTPQARLVFLAENVFTARAMYFESPGFDVQPIGAQIIEYEASPWHGRGDSVLLNILIGLLFALGLWKLARPFNADSLFIICVLLVPALIMLLTNPLPFDRYLVFLQIPYALIAGIGAEWVYQHARVIRPRLRPTDAAS